jgi:hypothetical protein
VRSTLDRREPAVGFALGLAARKEKGGKTGSDSRIVPGVPIVPLQLTPDRSVGERTGPGAGRGELLRTEAVWSANSSWG